MCSASSRSISTGRKMQLGSMMCLLCFRSKPQNVFLAFASQLLFVELNTALSFWKVKTANASADLETAPTFWKSFCKIASRISHGRANAGMSELHCLLQNQNCIVETALTNCKSETALSNCIVELQMQNCIAPRILLLRANAYISHNFSARA